MTHAMLPLGVIILGATSAIAEATARIYASEGAAILLAARRAERLEQIAADLRLRGATRVETVEIELTSADAFFEITSFEKLLGKIDHVIVAYGVMPDQTEAERDAEILLETFKVNLVSAATWALAAANLLERQGSGTLVVLGSPAGDRGRRRNFVYGASKAGLEVLVQGIAHRFRGMGPRAVLLKPPPTATRMTNGLDRARLSTPERTARAVRRAAGRGGVVQYTSVLWWVIMCIVRALPSSVFNRLDI